ncbi:class I tRNA ligase family protein, partial [bacterium]|nr:class I tRNA ligase family protein [bacterium]
METYNPKVIEAKWREIWGKANSSKIDRDDDSKEKFYILDMFPYPSGTGLHMGHTETYAASDVFYRFKKMQGYNVLHPQGFDSFGLPTENYAIKTRTKPAEITQQNITTFINQMKSLGFDYDFSEKVITSDPGYYKWTQWIFGKFFEQGWVYKKTQKANWCSSCQTVIANEQVLDGKCERCGTEILQKEVPGWFFKITDFAEELI